MALIFGKDLSEKFLSNKDVSRQYSSDSVYFPYIFYIYELEY